MHNCCIIMYGILNCRSHFLKQGDTIIFSWKQTIFTKQTLLKQLSIILT